MSLITTSGIRLGNGTQVWQPRPEAHLRDDTAPQSASFNRFRISERTTAEMYAVLRRDGRDSAWGQIAAAVLRGADREWW